MSISTTQELVVVECWCGVLHAIPDGLNKSANEGHKVYCPLGHVWVRRETDAKRLQKEVDQLRDAQQRLLRRCETEQRQHAATKGQLTRARKRAANGVCPCCSRSFVDVARHVKTKHPDYVAEVAST